MQTVPHIQNPASGEMPSDVATSQFVDCIQFIYMASIVRDTDTENSKMRKTFKGKIVSVSLEINAIHCSLDNYRSQCLADGNSSNIQMLVIAGR